MSAGQSYSHTYDKKSRYNLLVIGKLDGDKVSSFGFLAMDAWTEEPTEWPRSSFIPPTTGNPELDAVLQNASIDNSSYTRKVSGCSNDGGGNCLNSTDESSTCIRFCIY